jgi:hypothetical protein
MAAPANAGDSLPPAPAQRDASGERAGPRPPIGLEEAKKITGLSVSTLRRRVDAWNDGDRSDFALRGSRSGPTSWRYVDPDDAEALAAQLRGELPPGRHPQE